MPSVSVFLLSNIQPRKVMMITIRTAMGSVIFVGLAIMAWFSLMPAALDRIDKIFAGLNRIFLIFLGLILQVFIREIGERTRS